MKTTSNGRQTQIEYLINHLLDHIGIITFKLDDQTIFYNHTQTLNLSLDDKTMFSNPKNEDDFQWKTTSTFNLSLDEQTIFYKSLKLRQPQMEKVLKILKVEYLNTHLLDQTQILNFSLDGQTIVYKSLKLRRPPMAEDLRCKDGLKVCRM